MANTTLNPRRFLSADGLIKQLRYRFSQFIDARRQASVIHPLTDVLMAAFAMFSLKDPSLLAFQERINDEAIKSLYGLDAVPSDSQMRDVLDPLDPQLLNACFVDIFHQLQRGGVLKDFVFDEGYYLIAIDGTGHFCSTSISCPHCLEKQTKGGKTEYHHQAVVATLVHPDRRETFPLAIEPIIKQDGETKNDCERNATRRLLKRLRAQHPNLKMMVVEDGLASNGPHIRDLQELGFRFLLGAKPGDHKLLFAKFAEAQDRGEVRTITRELKGGGSAQTQYASELPLNASHQDL